MRKIKIEYPRSMKGELRDHTLFNNIKTSPSLKKQSEKKMVDGLPGGKDYQRKKVYKWEIYLLYKAKIINQKAYETLNPNHSLKDWNLDQCKVFLNRVLKKEFNYLRPLEKLESRYFSRYKSDLSLFEVLFYPILPIWDGKNYAYSDFFVLNFKNEEKFFIWDNKYLRSQISFQGKITNQRLKIFLEEEVDDEVVIAPYNAMFKMYVNKVKVFGKKKVKIYYTPNYVGMNFPPGMRNKYIMLHELAHLLSEDFSHHGPKFVSVLIYLYNKYLKIKYSLIFDTIDEKKVHFDGNHSWVPLRYTPMHKLKFYY